MTEHTRVQSHLYEFLKNELPLQEQQRIEQHIASCSKCREEVKQFSLALQELDRATMDWSGQQPPEYWNTFAYSVQARIKKEPVQGRGIVERFTEWFDSVIAFRARDIAIAGVMCTMIFIALIAGRNLFLKSEQPVPRNTVQQEVPVLDSDYVRLHDYFRRSRALLVGLANLKMDEDETFDLKTEQSLSRNLILETRRLKQQPLDTRSERLIGDMEKILIKIANSKYDDNSPELQFIRDGIERSNLLYKVRRAEATYKSPQAMFANYREQ